MPRPCSLRAALIDLDGTLLDTAGELAGAVNAMRQDLGLAALDVARIASFVGKGAAVLVHRALTDSHDGLADDAAHAQGLAAFKRHYERINGTQAQMYPGVLDGLASLHAQGLRLACVTNKPRDFAQPLLARTGLARHFELLVAGGDTARAKPHPDPFEHAAQHLNVHVAQCVVIGDSANDAQAGRAAGMAVLLVPYGYSEGEPVSRAFDAGLCDAIVSDLVAAADWIAGQGAQPNHTPQ
jgi:phosphoglycolate phosphatase